MLLKNLVENTVQTLKTALDEYKTVYLDSSILISHIQVIYEYLKSISGQNKAVVYFVNNLSNQEVLMSIKRALGSIDGFKLSTIYKNIEPNSITIIGTTESNIDKKIKSLDNDCDIILINDCTKTIKSFNINKIKKLIHPTRVINMVHSSKLTESEHIAITTQEVGYVYCNAEKVIESKFIKGLVVNPSEELKSVATEEHNLRHELVLAGLKKLDDLNIVYSPKNFLIKNQYLNIKYLIIVKNIQEAKEIKEFVYNSTERSYSIEIVNELTQQNIDDHEIIITYAGIELPNYELPEIQVVTMLKDTCQPSSLFELYRTIKSKSLDTDDELYRYKYLYVYDNPEIVKKSLTPPTYRVPVETITPKLRNDVDEFLIDCKALESVEYEEFDKTDTEFMKTLKSIIFQISRKYISNTISRKNLLRKGFCFDKDKQPILIDSFIKSHTNYTFNTGYMVDIDLQLLREEAFGLVSKFISNNILSENLKIGKNSRKDILNMILSWGFNLQTSNPASLSNEDMAIMVINDMKNINTSIFAKMIGDFFIEFSKLNKNKEVQLRKIIDKKVTLPIIQNMPLKPSECIRTKRGAYNYVKKLVPETEKQFMDYLEHSIFVDWWCKNGDIGSQNFSVTCVDKKGLPQGFYPDWIIKVKDKRLSAENELYLIVDTKAGMTLDDSGLTGAKIKSLQAWCEVKNNIDSKRKFLCGIITYVNGFWQISDNNIDYIIDMNYSNFVKFEDWLNQKIKELKE